MSESNLADAIVGAFERLSTRPVVGPLTVEIWDALDLNSLAEPIFSGLIQKAKLTSQDKQLHSFTLMHLALDERTVLVTGMTWPNSLSEVRAEAKENFFKVAGMFAAADLAGALQFDLFLGGPEAPDLRMAWLPFLKASAPLPAPLRRSLLPWGTEPRPSVKPAAAPVGGPEILALAEVAWKLTKAMEERLIYWPAESGPARPGFKDVRDRFSDLVYNFNAAVKHVGLSHTLPIFTRDDTWLPHNLRNSLRFRSLPASLKADLLRLCGPEARDRFAQAWALFEEAHPQRPAEEPLAVLRESPLPLQPAGALPLPQQPIDVFISYAWSDKTRGARDIYELVTGSGLTAWIDEEQRPAGSHLNDEIGAAMLRSSRIVVCHSLEMLTRGGYALREVLLALSSAPERCLIARLDRMPLVPMLDGIRSVNWSEPGGPDEMLAALRQPPAPPPHEVKKLSLEGPLIDKLIDLLRRPEPLRRRLDAPGRRKQVALRSQLCRIAYAVADLHTQRDWGAMVAAVDGSPPGLMRWGALDGPAAAEEPMVFMASLRLRSAVFQAHIQLSAHADWNEHNRAAYKILEEVINVEPGLLRPAAELGWLAEDCRLAVQDCLDLFHFTKDWFLGWSPDMLVEMSGVPADLAMTVEGRIKERMALLGERMLALRAWEDCEVVPEVAPSWARVWPSLRQDLSGKLKVGAHPHTTDYFEELSRWLTPDVVDELATALSDGVVESRVAGSSREEIFLDFPDFRMRCLIRCAKSLENKWASLASVQGSVYDDLRLEGDEAADFNILYWLFTEFDAANKRWSYGLYMNCAPSERAEREGRLPPVLRRPFTMVEMLTDDERSRLLADASIVIYEEL
jgi:hypothetical protein